MKRINMEKSNEVLFRLYDENKDKIKQNYIDVKFNDDTVAFTQYKEMVGNRFDELYFKGEIEIKINEEEKDILKKTMNYDDVIIVEGNEIRYEGIIKNKKAGYCRRLYQVKYNRTQIYAEECNRYFKDYDRKWCIEDHDLGEGKSSRLLWEY